MLVRYRLSSESTLANFQADIDGIIQGTITQVNQLSAPAQANTIFYGSYPTGAFTRVNGTSYTYSKVHNSVTSKTHYFRLTFDAAQLTTITLAQGYTSGTDTLLNTSAQPVNIQRFIYDSNYPESLDIIVNDKMLFFRSAQSGVALGIFDIGHSGVTREYADSMLMMFQDMSNVPDFKTNTGGTIPYTYNFDSLSYGTVTTSVFSQSPIKKNTALKKVAVFENPISVTSTQTGSTLNLLYGAYKIPIPSIISGKLYQDTANLYRLPINNISLLVD